VIRHSLFIFLLLCIAGGTSYAQIEEPLPASREEYLKQKKKFLEQKKEHLESLRLENEFVEERLKENPVGVRRVTKKSTKSGERRTESTTKKPQVEHDTNTSVMNSRNMVGVILGFIALIALLVLFKKVSNKK